jgi:NAD(P)H-dependent FMN reductase
MEASQKLNIEVIVGTTRPNRFSEKPARWIFDEASKRPELDVQWVDLRDYPLPFYDEPLSPVRLAGQYTHAEALAWGRKVAEADGYIIVAGEYNHGYPAVLKNALDYVYSEWNEKAVGFVGYGNAGGARSIEQLRQVAVELRMAPIKSGLHIPRDVYLAAINFKAGDPNPFSPLQDLARQFLDQLTAWTRAVKALRGH